MKFIVHGHENSWLKWNICVPCIDFVFKFFVESAQNLTENCATILRSIETLFTTRLLHKYILLICVLKTKLTLLVFFSDTKSLHIVFLKNTKMANMHSFEVFCAKYTVFTVYILATVSININNEHSSIPSMITSFLRYFIELTHFICRQLSWISFDGLLTWFSRTIFDSLNWIKLIF